MWSNVHDLFHVRNMFYSQSDPVFYDSCRANQPNEAGEHRENIKKQKASASKTNASPGGEAQVMGGFPKRSASFIRNLCNRS
jgi:hypothetical protein